MIDNLEPIIMSGVLWGGIPILFFAIIAYIDLRQYSHKLEFRYKRYGIRDGKKTPLLLIPGLDGATAFFNEIVPELTALGYDVIVYNIPLKNPSTPQSEYTFTHLASKLKDVIEEIGLSKVSLIGESFGGIIALQFASDYPNFVDKLVTVSSLAKTELPPEVQFKLDYLFPIVYNLGKLFPSLAQLLFARIHVDDVVEPSDPAFVRELFIKEATFAHFHSVMARILIASKLDIVERVKTIKNRTLIVYGTEDHFTKKDYMLLNSLIENSRTEGIEGGHLVHVTKPKIFVERVHDFIEEPL